MLILTNKDEFVVCDCGCRYVAQEGDFRVVPDLRCGALYTASECPECHVFTLFTKEGVKVASGVLTIILF